MAFGHGRLFVADAKLDWGGDEDALAVEIVYRPAVPSVWYARFVGLASATPLMIYLVGKASGVDTETLYFAIAADITMALCWLIATLLPNEEASKWMFWLIGMVFYLILLYSILRSFRVAAVKRGGAVAKNYGVVVWVIVFTWTVYPFVWVTAEGAHVLSEDVSVIL